MKIKLIFLFMIFLSIFSGCQYQSQVPLPTPTAKIAIPLFINKTSKEDLDEVLTREVIDQFTFCSSLQLVSEKEAGFILRGEILQYLNEPTSEVVTTSDEYRIVIEIAATLISMDENQIVWKEKVTEDTMYSILQVDSIQTEQEAVKQVSGKIGEILVNLTLEGWKN